MVEAMKAALLFGPSDLRVVEVETPRPGPEDVLVRVARYAPYGTDVATYVNRGGRYVMNYPVGIGADFSGVIEELGTDVRGFSAGDRVSALAMDHCGVCRNCRRGRTNLCLDENYLTRQRQVCGQSYAVVDARKLEKLPDGVSFDDGAMLTGPVTALNAIDRIKPSVEDRIAVVGTGVMGWGAIAVARATGHVPIALGGSGRRAAIASGLGADPVFETVQYGDDAVERARAYAPDGVDCLIETTATDWGLQQSVGIAAPGARIAFVGGGPLPVSGWDLVAKELSIFGLRAGPRQDTALSMIANNRIDLKPTITHRFGLEEVPKAFELLSGPDLEAVGRVMIDVDPDQ